LHGACVLGLRAQAIEGATLIELLPQIGILSAWLVVIYALAIKFFRWE
jgi:hypothetical protein